MAVTQIDSNNFQPNASIGSPTITNIQVTNSSYAVLDDTAVSTTGGFIKITGTKFNSGVQVYIGTALATSISLVSSTVLNVQVPATIAGSYDVIVVNTDGTYGIKPIGITFSPVGITWVTSSSLGPYQTGIAISLQLSATGAAGYQLQSGSTLPTGLTLSSGGLLSGTVNVGSDTTYSFTIEAYDSELQDAPRTFSLPIVLNAVPSSIELLVVAGGGGGGGNHGGGGGAGGLLYGTYSVSTSTTYTVTIGGGGSGSSSGGSGTNGSNSVFALATAIGGGRGGSYSQDTSPAAGGSGAGGTSRAGRTTGALANQGNSGGLTGYGNNGGNAVTGQTDWPGGGGGGAGAVGTNATNAGKGGNGGNGRQYDISGTNAYYGGGGGGCGQYQTAGQQGSGGLGGGANGSVDVTPAAATANTGGGGGGARDAQGSSGGSGIVILRYPDTFLAPSSTTGNPTVTVAGGFRIYRFTGSGSITF